MRGIGLKSSLRKQIIISSLLCLIIPFTITLYLGNRVSTNLIEKQASRNAEESLKLVRAQLTAQMEGLFSIANSIQFDAQITPYLKSPIYVNADTTLSYVTDKLYSLTHDKSGVSVTILTKDRRFFTNYMLYNEFNPLQMTQAPWFPKLDKLQNYENYWVGLQKNYLDMEKTRDPYVITFARMLPLSYGNPYAYVIISISEQRIRALFSSYQEQDIMLLSPEGTILSGREGVGESFPYFDQLQMTNRQGLPVLTIGGEKHVFVIEPLPFAGWTLVSLMPYSKATESITQVYQVNFLWQIGFIVLFLVILVWILHRFTKPVARLGEVVSNIETGNLSIRSEVRGSNEIGKLGRSLDQMLDRIEEMVDQIKWEQEQARKAELSMLQAQISPHFLFNVLNSIRMRIQLKGDRENADLISSLSKLLRMTIQRQEKLVTLKEEVDIASWYMDLMKSTVREPFEVQLHLIEESEQELVPRFILQPIIENALIHGFRGNPGTVTLESNMSQDSLSVRVKDNGCGMTLEELGKLREKLKLGRTQAVEESSKGMSGIGVANVYSRLYMLFGSQCSMDIESEPGSGTTVTVTIPLIRGLEHD
jgi:two-component system, sensor histidine kinase YesM